MNFLQENKFLSYFILSSVVVLGALGYLLSNSMARYNEISQNYTAAVGKLHTLQNRVPFPNDENLTKTQEQIQNYKDLVQNLAREAQALELPLESDITPQAFQDRLRQVVSEVENRAKEKNVILPKDFYLGFDPYRTTLPSEVASAPLARQLQAIRSLVDKLIDLKVESIETLVRVPLPEEQGAFLANAQEDKKEPVVKKYPFDISFRTEQGRFRLGLNSLLNSEQFFVLRSINVMNSNTEGPKRQVASELGTAPATPSPIFGNAGLGDAAGQNKPEKSALDVIVGRETLKVTLRVEMIDFNIPDLNQ